MALVIEDGTGLPNSNSYIAVADADAYFTDRNNAAWLALDNPTKTGYVILAADYLQQRYRLAWNGFRRLNTQAMDWPRSYAIKPDIAGGYGPVPYYYGFNEIPTELITAQILLAVKLLNGDLAPDIDPDDDYLKVKVGPIEVDRKPYGSAITVFRNVDMILAPLLIASGAQPEIVRT
jgi:hypothetical protein